LAELAANENGDGERRDFVVPKNWEALFTGLW